MAETPEQVADRLLARLDLRRTPHFSNTGLSVSDIRTALVEAATPVVEEPEELFPRYSETFVSGGNGSSVCLHGCRLCGALVGDYRMNTHEEWHNAQR